METKEDRLAIMRWETETGPTEGKNKRPDTGISAKFGSITVKAADLCTISYTKLHEIRIVSAIAGPGKTVH